MPQIDAEPYCVLETWDTVRKDWVPVPARHESVAAATSAATERGVYRVVFINRDRRLELDSFAIV